METHRDTELLLDVGISDRAHPDHPIRLADGGRGGDDGRGGVRAGAGGDGQAGAPV